MINLWSGLALLVLLFWSLVVTPKVIRRGVRMTLVWIAWLLIAALATQALLAEGLEHMTRGLR